VYQNGKIDNLNFPFC